MKFLNYKTDGTYGMLNLDVKEILNNVSDNDLVFDLVEIGIRLNRFIEDPNWMNDYDLIIWINPMNEKVSVERSGYSELLDEEIMENVEGFKITQDEIHMLLDFEENDYSYRKTLEEEYIRINVA